MASDPTSTAAARLSAIAAQIPNPSPPQLLHSYRKTSTTDKQQLLETFYGPKWQYRQKVFDIICNNSEKFSSPYIDEHNRERTRYNAFRELHFIQKQLNMGYAEYEKDPHAFSITSNAVYAWNPAVCVKFGVHFSLYGKTLMSIGTKKHLPTIHRMMKLEDIGSFALTEMAHGSNVRGIRTTATYEKETNSFLINTPNREDMKIWIGATAQLANMTICWAQLYVDGTCHGVHAFIVPIRNQDNHSVMPGVTIGDCGPKTGLDGIDNGFVMFHNVRIPYDNMLDRFSQIVDGKFDTWIKEGAKRFGLQMSSLSGGRVFVAWNAVTNSMIATTIAGRYAAIRQQFGSPSGQSEQSIIEYELTQQRILPNLATVIAQQLGALQLALQWDENLKHLQDVKNTLITELHAISSAVKANLSWSATRIITESRQILGGHGYSAFNRFGQLYNDNDVNMTWEGDNNVLLQQTSKFILDCAKKLAKGKKLPFLCTHYLSLENPDGQLAAFKEDADYDNNILLVKAMHWRVNMLLHKTSMKMISAVKVQKKSEWGAFNEVQPFYAVELAKAFGEVWVIESALQQIEKIQNPSNKKVLSQFLTLHMLDIINRDIGNFRVFGYINCEQHEAVRSRMITLCSLLKKEYIGVIDALAPPDFILQAPFGQSDGDIYNRYIGMIYAAKDTFKRVDWWKEVHKAHKKYNFGELEENN